MMVHNKILLAQKTGSGKSIVFHMVDILRRGVVLLIGPLLALMANQFRKAKSISSPFGDVYCYNLDQFKSTDSVTKISCDLCSISSDTNDTYYIFASPQTIPRFSSVIKNLYCRGLLRLLANDEYHFNLVYCHRFRPEVNALKHRLFQPYLRIRS